MEEAHLVLLFLELLLSAVLGVALGVVDAEVSFLAGRTSESTPRCKLADLVGSVAVDADEGDGTGDSCGGHDTSGNCLTFRS